MKPSNERYERRRSYRIQKQNKENNRMNQYSTLRFKLHKKKQGDKLNKRHTNLFTEHHVPCELLASIFQYLSWKDYFSVKFTCSTWATSLEGTSAPQWKTDICIADNIAQALEELRHSPAFDLHFPPNLAFVAIASIDSVPFRRGKIWKSLHESMIEKKLLPKNCIIIYLYGQDGIIGTDASGQSMEMQNSDSILLGNNEQDVAGSKKITFSLTIAHLPETTIKTFSMTRNDTRSTCDRIKEIEKTTNNIFHSYLLFCSNYSSSSRFIKQLSKSSSGHALVGGIFPYTDKAEPLAFFCPNQPNSKLNFAKNLCIAFSGKCGFYQFSTQGFKPCSQPLKCEEALLTSEGPDEIYYMYRKVILNDIPMTPAAAVREYGQLLDDMFQLSVFQTPHREDLLKLCETGLLPNNSEVDIIPLYISKHTEAFCSAGKVWEPSKWGQFFTLNSNASRIDLVRSLQNISSSLNERKNCKSLGVMLFPCCCRGLGLYGEAHIETNICQSVFPHLPVSGSFCGGEIGPAARPGGFQSHGDDPNVQNVEYLVQAYTTCGAVFYCNQ